MLISVIIPIYNVEKYLAKCLESVINQDISSMELICVNDASTDNSLPILKDFAKKDSRIKIIDLNINEGLANARNVGFENASGKYICYVDSDDMLAEGSFKKLLPYLKDELEMLTYEADRLLLDIRPENVTKNTYRLKYDYSKLGVLSGRKFFTEKMSHGDFYANVCFSLYNRLWLKNTGIKFKNGIIYEDGPYILECYLKCQKMRHVHIGVYVRRYRANSIMTKKTKDNFLYMKGALYCYENALRLYYQMEKIDEIEKKYLLQIVLKKKNSLIRHIMLLSPLERLKLQNFEGLDQILSHEIVGLVNNIENYFLEGLKFQIMMAKEVYLYGAGEVGLSMLSRLRMEKLDEKILGFLETNSPSQTKKNGVQIFCIKDIKPNDEILIIISASEKYQRDMFENAMLHGFKNIIYFDFVTNKFLEKI